MVQFKTKDGDEVYFNENGDPAAKYEIINWQPSENGTVDFVTVGLYDASLPADKQLSLQNKTLIWAQNSQQVCCDPWNSQLDGSNTINRKYLLMFVFCYCRCLYPFATRNVPQVLAKSFRKESLSAATTALDVQMDK